MRTQSTAGQWAGRTSNDLVLDRLPSGELAWLRPEAQDNDPRYVLTDAGRRALDEDRRARTMEALFGHPWPTAAETSAADVVA
jgi:hypothetical protein